MGVLWKLVKFKIWKRTYLRHDGMSREQFIMEVCKDTRETYPPLKLYSICSAMQRHIDNCYQENAVKFIGNMDNRYLDSSFIKRHPY